MSNIPHGLSIDIKNVDSNIILSLKAAGKLMHEGYETITPMIDSALNSIKEPKVKVLIDGTEMESRELRAACDDFKQDLKHGNAFEKIAIYDNRNWQEIAAKIGNWFISEEVIYFSGRDDALAWLLE